MTENENNTLALVGCLSILLVIIFAVLTTIGVGFVFGIPAALFTGAALSLVFAVFILRATKNIGKE